ncbi:MAG: HD domain-containing protein, partial [Clostridia bacterium]
METLEILWKEVEQILSCSAHDLSHVRRVFRMAERLAGVESMAGRGDADRHILGAAAILHDIARVQEDQDETRTIDHARLGAQMALEILREKGWTELDAQRVAACISTHRYRSGNA